MDNMSPNSALRYPAISMDIFDQIDRRLVCVGWGVLRFLFNFKKRPQCLWRVDDVNVLCYLQVEFDLLSICVRRCRSDVG